MIEQFLVVVGDKFSEFAAGKDALTLSQLRALLTLPSILNMGEVCLVLVPGQGLGDDDIAEVLNLASASAYGDKFDLSAWRDRKPRATGTVTHKKFAANTIISEPRQIDQFSFGLDLLIDENCEMMSDHQTGQHLQGMLLVEAARQSFLAVTERFFLPQDGGGKFYFVFDDLTVRYKRFVFPVDASLTYVVREMDLVPNRQRFVVDVAIAQCGHEVAVVSGTFTVVKDARIARMEGGMARDVLESHLASVREARSPSNVAEAA